MVTAKKAAAKPAKKAAAKPVKDRVDQAALAERYGYVAATINSNAELKRLFAQAYGTDKTGQWTAEKFAAAIRNSDWYKKHSEQWRKTEVLRTADPETYKASIDQMRDEVQATAGRMGANLDEAKARALAESYYRAGYSGTQVQQALQQYVTTDASGEYGGEAGQAFKSLRDYGDQMGVKRNASWYQSAVRSVAAGLSTLEDWTGDITKEAQSTYAPFAERIAQGQTVRDLASGYINTMAQTLELTPDQIGLDDATIQQALKGGMDKTGAPYAQSLWDFEKGLRGDARWQETKNAQQQANQTTMNILQAFGFQG